MSAHQFLRVALLLLGYGAMIGVITDSLGWTR